MLTFISCFVFYYFTNNFCFAQDFYVVDGLFDSTNGDIVAGFGDFNADKHIDIFVITNLGKQVDVLLVGENNQYERKFLVMNTSSAFDGSNFISGIMVVDFDGDGQMDILVNRKTSSSDLVTVEVHFGNGMDGVGPPYSLAGMFKDEPVLFDFDANMLPDLLAVDSSGNTVVWLAEFHKHNFTKRDFAYRFNFSVPHSSAFTQLVRNFNTDLILTTVGNSFIIFADNNYSLPNVTYRSENVTMLGPSSFADFNQDSIIDHIISVCKSPDCMENQIHVRHDDSWHVLLDLGKDWRFVMDGTVQLPPLTFPATLVAGDYNRDGFPDLLVVLNSTAPGSKPRPFLLKNIPCNNVGCSKFGRMFELQQSLLPGNINDVYLATFYDLSEDGTLDIILTAGKINGTSSPAQIIPHTVVLKNNLAGDTCFMKVTVISGICEQFCKPGNRKPYGVNTPGPTVRYHTTNTNGEKQESCAPQLSQSAHFALQLPFVMFGLGQTPNFVDKVEIGIPQLNNATVNRSREWTQIIPNSQLLVNPNTIDNPPNWKMQLFVMPSKQIYLTAIVLLATCIVLVFIVAILLWREKREDTREKKQESQKFHFDAM